MKFKFLLVITIFSSLAAYSQLSDFMEKSDQPTEHYLGDPDHRGGLEFIPKGLDLGSGHYNNQIWYGKTPKDSGIRPVLVFVHGFSANHTQWTTGKSNLYSAAFLSGYRTAFLSPSPNKSVMTNGKLIKNMLLKIKQKYGVNKVVLIGHSKGGVDCDAALSFNGAHEDVSLMLSLGAPHYGTWMAEVANAWWMRRIPFFGVANDGSRSIRRGAMNHFRWLEKKVPLENKLRNWHTLGAWGKGPWKRFGLFHTMLSYNGGSRFSGGNDGIVPYKSTKRPRARTLYRGQYWKKIWWFFGYWTGPKANHKDHFQIATKPGWSIINNVIRKRNSPWEKGSVKGIDSEENNITDDDYFPNKFEATSSNIFIGNGTKQEFPVEKSDFLRINILLDNENKANQKNRLIVKSPSGNNLIPIKIEKEERNPYQHKGETVNYEIAKPDHGIYSLIAPKNSVIIIDVEGGENVSFDTGLSSSKMVYGIGETPNFSITTSSISLKTKINGTIARTANLDASKVDNVQPLPLSYATEDGQVFKVKSSPFDIPGVYEVTLKVKGESFEKTLFTTISVANLDDPFNFNSEDDIGKQIKVEDIKVYPNPFEDTINISHSNFNEIISDIEIYDMFGRYIDIIKVTKDTKNIRYTFSNASSGTYILSYDTKNGRKSTLVIRK